MKSLKTLSKIRLRIFQSRQIVLWWRNTSQLYKKCTPPLNQSILERCPQDKWNSLSLTVMQHMFQQDN